MNTNCPICAKEVSELARKCPNCGSFQKKSFRIINGIVKVFSGIAILITAITLCISFFPEAYRSVFYEDDIEIHSIKPRISGGKGLITIENKGDGDIFINEISFALEDTVYNIKPRNIIVNQWIKKSEVLSLPYSAFANSPNYQLWPYISATKFIRLKESLSDSLFAKARIFFRLEIFDQEYNDNPFPQKIAGLEVKGIIRYSSFKSSGLQIKRSEKKLIGLIRENEGALKRLLNHD